jgi:hypothetical protein
MAGFLLAAGSPRPRPMRRSGGGCLPQAARRHLEIREFPD